MLIQSASSKIALHLCTLTLQTGGVIFKSMPVSYRAAQLTRINLLIMLNKTETDERKRVRDLPFGIPNYSMWLEWSSCSLKKRLSLPHFNSTFYLMRFCWEKSHIIAEKSHHVHAPTHMVVLMQPESNYLPQIISSSPHVLDLQSCGW